MVHTRNVKKREGSGCRVPPIVGCASGYRLCLLVRSTGDPVAAANSMKVAKVAPCSTVRPQYAAHGKSCCKSAEEVANTAAGMAAPLYSRCLAVATLQRSATLVLPNTTDVRYVVLLTVSR